MAYCKGFSAVYSELRPHSLHNTCSYGREGRRRAPDKLIFYCDGFQASG